MYERLSLLPDRPERVWTIGRRKQLTIESLEVMSDTQMGRSLWPIWPVPDLSQLCRQNGLHLLLFSCLHSCPQAALPTATRTHCHHSDSLGAAAPTGGSAPLPSHLWHPRAISREIMRAVRAERMNWCEQAQLWSAGTHRT